MWIERWILWAEGSWLCDDLSAMQWWLILGGTIGMAKWFDGFDIAGSGNWDFQKNKKKWQ